MKYIIMCGCAKDKEHPKQLLEVNGEALISRTIRLLRENGVDDIAISSHHPAFDELGVPVLVHDNRFYDGGGYWVDAFYPTNEPVCYIFGDVFFSEDAIKKIVNTGTNDVEFFASAPPFGDHYAKQWAEPFAFKVVNQNHFQKAIETVKRLCDEKKFNRHPIAWELWQVIKQTPLNIINYSNYTPVNDFTCDIDEGDEIPQFRFLQKRRLIS